MAVNSLILKTDWDSVVGWDDTSKASKDSPVYIKNDSYFRIKDFLVRRERGSLIISGERGAGKTTTVMTLLNDLGENMFPVYINALHLESIKEDSKSFLNTIEIIKELISQYSRQLEKKGYSKDENLKKLLTLISATSFIKKEYLASEGKIGVDSNLSLGASNAVVAATVSLKSALSESFKDEEIFIKAGYSIEDYSRDFSEIIEKLEVTKSSKKIIDLKKVFKNGISFSLSLGKFNDDNKATFKTVFIIDELDYYDKDEAATKPGFKEVLDAVKKLKNLLTLSGAHFIFITGKNAYRHAINPDNDYNTLFSERVFVVKPNGEELIEYLGKVITSSSNSERAELFKWMLIEESNHNYFLLEQAIKSRQKVENEKLILAPVLSETEEKVVLVHVAMNTIYSHFMKIGLFEHHSELLFNELSAVKENFNRWIHAEGLHPVSLSVSGGDDARPIIRNYIKDAKRSFIRYLFKISETEAPIGLEDLTLETIEPPWDKLKPMITLSAVKKGIAGAITNEEIEVVSLSNSILNDINAKLRLIGSNSVNSIDNALGEAGNKFSLPIDLESISSIKLAVDSITNKLFYERDPKITKTALDLLKTFEQSLKSRFVIFNKMLLRIDAGEATIVNGRLIFRDGARVTVLSDNKKANSNFEVRFKFLFPSEGLINLVSHSDLSASPNDKYFMFRFDTRGPNGHQGNGILMKEKGSTVWQYVDELGENRSSAPVNKYTNARVKFDNNKASLWVKSKDKDRYKLITDLQSWEESKQLSFALELGEIQITSLTILKSKK